MKPPVKIAIAVVLLIAAAIVTVKFTMGGEDAVQVADETRTLWMCTGCSETCELSAKQVAEKAREAGPPSPPLICQKCKEKKVYRALKCDKCQTIYFGNDVPDSNGVCPKCNPDFKPTPIIEEPEEAAPTDEGGGEKDEGGPVKAKKRPKAA